MTIKLTRDLAWSVSIGAANRAMRAGGRTEWSQEDYNEARKEFDRLWPLSELVTFGIIPEPDAQLIAAAPELLGALKDLMDWLSQSDLAPCGELENAVAAIAKAETTPDDNVFGIIRSNDPSEPFIIDNDACKDNNL